MKKMSILVVVFLVFIASSLWSGDSQKNTETIKSIMAKQVEAWNNGSFEGFMAGYWKSPEMTFQSGNRRLVGWEQLLAMYKKNYAGKKRGTLDFVDIEVKWLTPELALVLGRWRVNTDEKTKEGLFTLIFKRMDKDWKIIHDHSS